MWRLLLAMGFFSAATSITESYFQEPFYTTDYIFSNVTCPEKHFQCWGSEACLSRDLFCDGIEHCPYGDDESDANCVNVEGSVNDMLFNRSLLPHNTHDSFLNCSLPVGSNVHKLDCLCRNLNYNDVKRAMLICDNNTNVTRLPDIPAKFESIMFQRNDLKEIELANPVNRERWKILSLRGNKIEVIRKGVLNNLYNLYNLFISDNLIHTIEDGAFKSLNEIVWLVLDKNRLKRFNFQNLKDTPSLKHFSVAYNQLSFDKGEKLYLPNTLLWLGLEGNRIRRIEANQFEEGPKNVVFLNLSYNEIEEVDEYAFKGFPHLRDLSLDHNRISYLKPKTFFWSRNLTKLYLGHNFFTTLPLEIFSQIPALVSLDLTDIELANINHQHFANLRNANFFFFKKFRYCSYAPHVKVCSPRMDGLSSTEHLLVGPILRLSVWVVALVTIFSNSVVFGWRILSRKEDRVLSLFVKNLSVADFLMGIYLLAVAIHDVIYRNVYNRYAMSWMTSWRCMICGVMAMLSCEVSVLILSLITFERYRCIRTNVRVVTEKAAKYALLAVWMTGLLLALLPLSQIDGLNSFYASNGLCFPLHIHDAYMVGWQYSAFVFLGINFLAVLLIISLYLWMFVKIKRDRRRARPVLLKQREDAVLARRFFFIVLTDCLCWIPIIIIKILALSGISINDNLYAFIVVFILPVNSALNPVIYTLAAPTELRRRIRQMVPGKWFCKTRHSFASTDSKTANSSLATQSSSMSDGRSNSNGTVIIPTMASSRPGTILESSNEESDVGDETKL